MNQEPKNYLKINRDHRSISCGIKVIGFIDKDTKYFVKYIPAFEMSGYGETEKEADEMLNFSIDDFFKYLLKLSPKKMKAELVSLGWEQDKFQHKQFSNAYVDEKGNPNNFNAEENTVKISRIELEEELVLNGVILDQYQQNVSYVIYFYFLVIGHMEYPYFRSSWYENV